MLFLQAIRIVADIVPPNRLPDGPARWVTAAICLVVGGVSFGGILLLRKKRRAPKPTPLPEDPIQ